MDGSRPGRQLIAPVLTSLGAIGSAILALSCCVAPMALASLGLGSLGLAALTQHARPFFLVLTVLLLGYTTWLSVRNRRRLALAAADCACDVGSARRTARILNITLLAASAGVLVLLASPRLAALGKPPAADPAGTESAQLPPGHPEGVSVSFPVTGVSCEGCAASIQKALSSVEPIDDFRLDVKGARFSFFLASATPPVDRFASAVKALGYGVGAATVTTVAAKAGPSCACHRPGK